MTITVDPRLEVSAPDGAVDAAVDGVGVTLVLEHDAAAAIKAGHLKVLLKEFEVEPRTCPYDSCIAQFDADQVAALYESLGHFGKA